MLALSYRQLERDGEADALLNRCLKLAEGARDDGWATPILFVRLAEIYALMGDTDNAISNLDIAFNKGWRGLSTIEYGIFWQHFDDDPELNRIKVLILDDLEMRKKDCGRVPRKQINCSRSSVKPHSLDKGSGSGICVKFGLSDAIRPDFLPAIHTQLVFGDVGTDIARQADFH